MKRNLGLDIARSMAIISVIIGHGCYFFGQYRYVAHLNMLGLFGVEIFFVLSGFLVGKIIINDVMENASWISILRFYLRRWFRTLPLYYLMVLFLILMGNSLNWTNLIFVQNFKENNLVSFPVSWSLSIEEWFYLITPFLLLVVMKFCTWSKKKTFFLICIIIGLISFVLRIYFVIKYNPTWDFGVRKQIFLRLDSLMLGVIISGVKAYFKDIYESFAKYTRFLFITSFVTLISIAFVYQIIFEGGGEKMDNSALGKIFLFSALSVSFALLIIALERNNFINNVLPRYKLAKVFPFISKTSYAVYLIHYNIIVYFIGKTPKNTNLFIQIGLCSISILITYVVGYIIYRFYEMPIMNIANKLNFTNKHKEFKF